MLGLSLNIARVLLLLGFGIGMISWWYTASHVGDETYLLIPEFELGQTHAWYHAFREAIGDIAKMGAILLIFFGPASLRSRLTWIVCLILMFGYYAPFWIGMPFLAELSAPNLGAELIHVFMAGFAVTGLIIARPHFVQ